MSTTTHQPIYQMDRRGFIRACPNCGQQNRLLYKRLGSAFRCTKCQTSLPHLDQPVDVPGAIEFDELIAQSALPVLVDFWAPWCGPCKMVAPEFVKIAAAGAGRWIVAKVNTEELPDLGARLNVRAIPTMALFKNGIEVARQTGAMPAARIQQFIEQAAGTTR
jgi:thioredoxin 2